MKNKEPNGETDTIPEAKPCHWRATKARPEKSIFGN